MGNENSSQGDKKGGKFVVGIVILIVIILVLAGTVVYLLMSKKPEEKPVTNNDKRNVVITSDNVDEIVEQMENSGEEPVPVGYYTAVMNYEWHFKNGNEPSDNAYVENKVTNTNDVFFDLFLASDEDNAIYKSPVIPIGSSLRNITLDKVLDKGTYDCVAVYHLIDDEQNTLSTLRVTVTVIVEE